MEKCQSSTPNTVVIHFHPNFFLNVPRDRPIRKKLLKNLLVFSVIWGSLSALVSKWHVTWKQQVIEPNGVKFGKCCDKNMGCLWPFSVQLEVIWGIFRGIFTSATWPLGMKHNLMSYGKWLSTTSTATRPTDLLFYCSLLFRPKCLLFQSSGSRNTLKYFATW